MSAFNTLLPFYADVEKTPDYVANTECMQAALEALSGVNNIGGYTSFRALYTVDVNNYSDFVIIGDHIFH